MPTSNNGSVCINDSRISSIEGDVRVIKNQHLGLEKGLAELTETMKQLVSEMAKSRDHDHQLTLANALQLSKLEGLDGKVTALHTRLDKQGDRLDVLDKDNVTTHRTNAWMDRAIVGIVSMVAMYAAKTMGLV